MAQNVRVVTSAEAPEANVVRVPEGTDLIEWYFERGWTDGLPVVPPTRKLVDGMVEALGDMSWRLLSRRCFRFCQLR